MSNPNEAITIRQVINGFIVDPAYRIHRGECGQDQETRVFQSYAEMEDFLSGHFEHRGAGLKSDPRRGKA